MKKQIRLLIENLFDDIYDIDQGTDLSVEIAEEYLKYHPKTKDELRKLIEKLLNERGKNANLNDIDVSNITDMSNLFEKVLLRYRKPIKLDLSSWDTSNVTDMQCMFYECMSLKELDLSGWDISNVTNMDQMFYGCKRAIIPHWY